MRTLKTTDCGPHTTSIVHSGEVSGVNPEVAVIVNLYWPIMFSNPESRPTSNSPVYEFKDTVDFMKVFPGEGLMEYEIEQFTSEVPNSGKLMWVFPGIMPTWKIVFEVGRLRSMVERAQVILTAIIMETLM